MLGIKLSIELGETGAARVFRRTSDLLQVRRKKGTGFKPYCSSTKEMIWCEFTLVVYSNELVCILVSIHARVHSCSCAFLLLCILARVHSVVLCFAMLLMLVLCVVVCVDRLCCVPWRGCVFCCGCVFCLVCLLCALPLVCVVCACVVQCPP